MSTRASIIIKDRGATVCKMYHHHDGYELGVGDTLHTVFNPYDATDHKRTRKELIPLLNKLEILQPWRELEPASTNHGDTEYLYIVELDPVKITYYKGGLEKITDTRTSGDYELQQMHPRELTGDLLESLKVEQRERIGHYRRTGERK